MPIFARKFEVLAVSVMSEESEENPSHSLKISPGDWMPWKQIHIFVTEKREAKRGNMKVPNCFNEFV
jgi:hypothetical protein